MAGTDLEGSLMRAVAMLLVVGMGCGAGPLPALTPQQAQLARERAALWKQAQDKWKAGERAAALASMEKAVALAQRVWGPHSRLALVDFSWLAGWEQELGRWDRAAGHAERLAAIQGGLLGEGHWQAIDARWRARTARLMAGWS